jgi:hypothetical protein
MLVAKKTSENAFGPLFYMKRLFAGEQREVVLIPVSADETHVCNKAVGRVTLYFSSF